MSYRKHKVIQRENGRVSVCIAWSAEYQEYRVRLTLDDSEYVGADYFTDDLRDAQETAEGMANTAAAELTHQTRKIEFFNA